MFLSMMSVCSVLRKMIVSCMSSFPFDAYELPFQDEKIAIFSDNHCFLLHGNEVKKSMWWEITQIFRDSEFQYVQIQWVNFIINIYRVRDLDRGYKMGLGSNIWAAQIWTRSFGN